MTERNVPYTKAVELAQDAGTAANLVQSFDANQASSAARTKYVPYGFDAVCKPQGRRAACNDLMDDVDLLQGVVEDPQLGRFGIIPCTKVRIR